MNKYLTLLALLGSFSAIELSESTKYISYISEFGKQYGTKEEFNFRKALFDEKERKIAEWNANPNKTHNLGHNKFSDWTEDEFKKMRGTKINNNLNVEQVVLDTRDLPDSVDWRSKGAVTPVQN